jgi:hypothetical protein
MGCSLCRSRVASGLHSQFGLNGPAMQDEEHVQQLLEKSFDYWMRVRSRNMRKSHCVRRPRDSTKVRPSAEEVLVGPGDSEAETEDSESESDADVSGTRQELPAVRVYGPGPEFGWVVMDQPDEEQLSALVQSKFRNVRVAAHRFDNKWDTGTWKPVKKKPKEHWVYYSSDKVWCKHDLKLDAY